MLHDSFFFFSFLQVHFNPFLLLTVRQASPDFLSLFYSWWFLPVAIPYIPF